MNRSPLWKNLLLIFIVLLAGFYASPNLYDQDPSMEISETRRASVDESTLTNIRQLLTDNNIDIKKIELSKGRILIRFPNSKSQLNAKELLAQKLGNDYIQALTLKAALPDWLVSSGAQQMNLGLDLRGGIHVLIDVDMEAAVQQRIERYHGDVRRLLREKKIRYVSVKLQHDKVIAKFKTQEAAEQATKVIGSAFFEFVLSESEKEGRFLVVGFMSKREIAEVKKFALDQNITTLRNRVNALGVAEPLIQRQGDRHIVVQLPGVQDPSKVKQILGATATLEYRLQDTKNSLEAALAGRIPAGSQLYQRRDGGSILLKKRIIVTGNNIIDSTAGLDQRNGSPMVSVRLDGSGAKRMLDMTTRNVGKPMAVVFIETRYETKLIDGKKVKRKFESEEVISVANILEPFGPRFQTTGLDSLKEATQLSLLLRAGALAAPIEIVEERTIGPSLGQESIDQGFQSVQLGLLLVMIFMVVYYRAFGMVANLALFFNLVIIVAVLSLLQATLTLPGIAGIVLTVGMAVDANVLIFERIREEVSLGNTPQASIFAGYEKAFLTIVDANITTLIAALVLFTFGTGPIKGFAVTLFIGILTSMFTAIFGTRVIVNLLYGSKRIKKLSI